MSLLMLHRRRLSIIHMKYEINARLSEMNQKLQDMQQYAANIANGSISIHDMANMPASMFNRTLMFMTFAHNGAMMSANQNMQNLMMMPNVQQQMAQMQDPNQAQMYQNWMYQNLYVQEREKFAKQEGKLLNQQEKQMQQEKARLETQLKMLEAELEGVQQGERDAIKQWKPEYVA